MATDDLKSSRACSSTSTLRSGPWARCERAVAGAAANAAGLSGHVGKSCFSAASI